MTRPRAADDFATIRARMEELRRERAPRAADDFAAIRARMEELRRERAQMSAARDGGPLCYSRRRDRASGLPPARSVSGGGESHTQLTVRPPSTTGSVAVNVP